MEKTEEMTDYFECKKCGNIEFRPTYKFSLRFYSVNFSDSLIYERVNEEKFECTKCSAKYTKEEIRRQLTEAKKKKKR